jgi:hypothetical protein
MHKKRSEATKTNEQKKRSEQEAKKNETRNISEQGRRTEQQSKKNETQQKNVSNLRKLMKLRKNDKKLVMIIQVNIIFFFLFVINQRKKYSYFYSNFSTKNTWKNRRTKRKNNPAK